MLRDLADAPEAEWQAERRNVETRGWGAQLLMAQDDDGQWAGGAFFPAGFTREELHDCGQPWTATAWALTQLREFGLDPACASARRTVELVGRNSRWDEGGQPFWQGEVEECINGRTVADGAYFGVEVSAIVERLLGQRLADGGWNCERANGSTRSSFASTINVLEGLLGYERATGGTPDSREARRSGEEYLLVRRLFRRLSTGDVADEQFLTFVHPERWRYDLLRALDYFRAASIFAGTEPDLRLGEAVERIRSRRRDDGTWALDWKQRGREWFAIDDGVGEPSRWVTLRTLRVLRWWDGPRLGKVKNATEQARKLTGKCLCGSVFYQVADAFEYAMNCHCSQCRRSTGSAFKPLAGIGASRLALTTGNDMLMHYGDEQGYDAHCRICGSLIYSVVRDGRYVHVAMGTLVDEPSIRPTMHIFVGSKAPWFEITDALPRFDGLPDHG